MTDKLRIMLRNTANGELEDHHFIDRMHALDWLKDDKNHNTRYTVAMVKTHLTGPAGFCGHFQKEEHEIQEEMTVEQFIQEALTARNAP